MTVALLVGTLLAIAALGFVMLPLFKPARRNRTMIRSTATALHEDAIDPVAALREVEFDRATGKLSDDDYLTLKSAFTASALELMRNADRETADRARQAAQPADPRMLSAVEAAVQRMRKRRACADCGPRPESDAVYCSQCGLFLEGSCEECGNAVREPGARFCSTCGHVLAA